MNKLNPLLKIKYLEEEIKVKELLYEEYEKLSLSVSSTNYSKEKENNPNTNVDAPFIKWIHKKDETLQEIKNLKEELTSLRDLTLFNITSLTSNKYKIILIERYLNFKSWKEIASIVHASLATVRRWHDEALNILNRNQLLYS